MKINSSYYLLIIFIIASCRNSNNNEPKISKKADTNNQQNLQTPPKSMKKFEIKPFITINGVGNSSGIVYYQDHLFIVGDNSGFLFKYHVESKKLERFPLVKNAKEITPKASKQDFESIGLYDGNLQIYGSGSSKKRNKQIGFSVANNSINKNSTKDIYKRFLETTMLTENDLNIEGVVFHNNKQYYFQRGNGAQATNGIFVVFENDIKFKSIVLPSILGLQCGFTDAVVHDNKCYFLATAENTTSTYLDGEIMGSIFGCVNLDTFTIEYAEQIASVEKMEGITVYKSDEKTITFLLCEDTDIEELKSNIYELKIYK